MTPIYMPIYFYASLIWYAIRLGHILRIHSFLFIAFYYYDIDNIVIYGVMKVILDINRVCLGSLGTNPNFSPSNRIIWNNLDVYLRWNMKYYKRDIGYLELRSYFQLYTAYGDVKISMLSSWYRSLKSDSSSISLMPW